jgi:hypothetical protein
MPKILTKLRIDEISAVDRGAGDNCKIVLWKRAPRVARVLPRYRGESRLHAVEGLTHAEALHWLLHHPQGQALAASSDESLDTLADLLCEASTKANGEAPLRHKHNEVSKMNVQNFTKAVAALGEHGFTKIIQNYADTVRQPNESAAQAFTRVFTEETEQGRAIRKFWAIAKNGKAADVSDDDEADDETRDAMEELETLTAQERKRNPRLSKAQAFAKVYSDNPELAARERLQNRPSS